MDECRIIQYTVQYRKRLWDYLHKTYPHYTDSYIDYCVEHAGTQKGQQPVLLVVKPDDNIVGCNLYFNTKAKVLGVEKNVRWSYNTFLDLEYRRTMGLDFTLENIKTESFGIGLSLVNRKIQKKIKALFFEGLYNCFFVNRSVCFSILMKLIGRSITITDKKQIKVGRNLFKKIQCSDEMKIPSGGYWCQDHAQVDFIRDKEFLDYRFFENKVFDYHIYKLVQDGPNDSCYFVVRPLLFKGVPSLFLVDFRYDMNNNEMPTLIIKAVNKIARKSGLGGVFCTTNDKAMIKYINKKLISFKVPNDLLAPRSQGMNEACVIPVTAADSDVDFLRN